MTTRATRQISKALKACGLVKAASTFTINKAVKLDGSGAWLDCSAGNAAQGFAVRTASAGAECEIYRANGGGVIPVLVGTGGATEGLYGVVVADGVTNSGTLGGGSTLVNIVCQFVETGVAGDIVGAIPLSIPAVKA